MNWDYHENKTRGAILESLKVYQLHPDLFGIPKEIADTVVVYRPEDLHIITDEVYKIVKKEMLEHVKRNQNPLD